MKVVVVTHKDNSNLEKIKQTLLQKWVTSKSNTQLCSNNFDRAIKRDCNEYAYAVLLNAKGEMVLIASLFAEYKLTRKLCQMYHLQVVYKTCKLEDQIYFQREVVKMLNVYKVMGLSVSESETFKPNQVFMDISLYDPQLRGGL